MSHPEDRIYGQWSGNPKGRKENPSLCREEVWPRTGWISHQCNFKRGFGPNNDFCKKHAKQYEEAKCQQK